jgi:hypothetical protein
MLLDQSRCARVERPSGAHQPRCEPGAIPSAGACPTRRRWHLYGALDARDPEVPCSSAWRCRACLDPHPTPGCDALARGTCRTSACSPWRYPVIAGDANWPIARYPLGAGLLVRSSASLNSTIPREAAAHTTNGLSGGMVALAQMERDEQGGAREGHAVQGAMPRSGAPSGLRSCGFAHAFTYHAHG